MSNNVRLSLRADSLKCDIEASKLRSWIKAIPSKTSEAVRPYGYYSSEVVVTNRVTAVEDSSDCWSAQVAITLGQPILIRELDMQIHGAASEDLEFIKLASKMSPFMRALKSGTVLVDDNYEALKSALRSLANKRGYLDAKFDTHQIDVYPEEYAADIALVFNSGPRYKIDSIQIVQDPPFISEDVVRGSLLIKKGEFIELNKLYKSQQELSSTNYFESVEIRLEKNQKLDGRVPISVVVTPANRLKYSMGLGFSTDTGARISLEYNNARISDHGHQFGTKAVLSERLSTVAATYKLPNTESEQTSWYNIESGYKQEILEDVESEAYKLGFSKTSLLDEHWSSLAFVDLVSEKFTDEESFLVVPGYSITYLDADNPITPRFGSRVQLEFLGASKALASDVSFASVALSYKGIHSFNQTNRILYRAQIATLWGDNIEEIPLSYRFFAGGDSSIRGYDYKSLSPQNALGELVGAEHLLVGSLEYEYKFYDDWAVAVFSDFGNAFNDDFEIAQSVGVGLRWFSPIGPIRLDIGVPIGASTSSANDEKGRFEIHLSLGSDL